MLFVQPPEPRARANVVVLVATTLLAACAVAATLAVCLFMLVTRPPPYDDSVVRTRMASLNQSVAALAVQSDAVSAGLSGMSYAFAELAQLMQLNDMAIFNSTEHTREGLMLFLEYLQQQINRGGARRAL